MLAACVEAFCGREMEQRVSGVLARRDGRQTAKEIRPCGTIRLLMTSQDPKVSVLSIAVQMQQMSSNLQGLLQSCFSIAFYPYL